VAAAKRTPSAYTRAHNAHPYLTQTVTSLVIYLLGDITAQKLVPKEPEPYDPMRTSRALIIGGLAAVPGYRWFLWLATSFNYSSRIVSLGVKVLINQMVFTPLFNTYFFGMQRALTGGNWEDISKRIVETVPTSWVNSWKVWPAVMAFNFTYIPLQFRSLFAGKFCSF
jgi:protein Mpv17